MTATGLRYTFALCSETPLVKPHDLLRMAIPLEINAQHCAAAWGFHPPAVVLGERGRLPPFCRPVVCVDDDSDPEALAVHYFDPVSGGPAARAYVARTSGLHTGPFSAVESIAHEILEMLGNPRLDVWMPWPAPRSDTSIQTPRELCDACQDTYTIEHSKVRWPVANFLMPGWFDPKLNDPDARMQFRSRGGKFDYCDRMNEPGEISPEGYVVLRSPRNGGFIYWNEWASLGAVGQPAALSSAKAQHPWSRSLRLRSGR